tara:strand:+ start:488 stop:622 length:135 start_codon:yes stop_codon:yes gene_type:complete
MFLEGEIMVTPDGGEPVRFCEGNLVIFAAGMKSKWDVHKAVCEH